MSQELPRAIYVWLVPSEHMLDQPGSWRIRKWDTEPFAEANYIASETADTTVAEKSYALEALQNARDAIREIAEDIGEARRVGVVQDALHAADAEIVRLEKALERTPSSVAHTDHPLRHFDRTCPACIAEGTPPTDEGRTQRVDALLRALASARSSARDTAPDPMAGRLEILAQRLKDANYAERGTIQCGTAGNANIVRYNGEDIVGCAHVYDERDRLLLGWLAENAQRILDALSTRSATGFTMGDAHPCDISKAVREQVLAEIERGLHDLKNLKIAAGDREQARGVSAAEFHVRALRSDSDSRVQGE